MIGAAMLLAALTGAPQATVTPAPPSAATADDTARLAAARALVGTLRSEAQMRAQQAAAAADAGASLDRFLPTQATMRAQLTDPQGFARARAEATKVVVDDRQRLADETIPLLIDAEVRRYAAHFTLAELRQLDAFYRSPLGQRLIATQPLMAADSARFQQSVLQPILAAHSAAIGPRLAAVLAPILRQASAPGSAAPAPPGRAP